MRLDMSVRFSVVFLALWVPLTKCVTNDRDSAGVRGDVYATGGTSCAAYTNRL